MKTLVLVVLAALLIGCAENIVAPATLETSNANCAWQYADANHEMIYVDVTGASRLIVLDLVYENGEVTQKFLKCTGYPVIVVNLDKKDSLLEVRKTDSPVTEKWQWVRGEEVDMLYVRCSVGYSGRYDGPVHITKLPEEILLHADWYNAPQLPSDFEYTLRYNGTYRDPCNHDGLERLE